jgi:hypothetical protein
VIIYLVARAVYRDRVHIFDNTQPNPFLPHVECEQITALIPYQNFRLLNIDMTIRPFFKGADFESGGYKTSRVKAVGA